MLNPMDLARILILMEFDISALLGYTGAVFNQFFGTSLGMLASFGMLSLWLVIPAWTGLRVFKQDALGVELLKTSCHVQAELCHLN
jgi:Cu-processing system permease protein